MNKDIQPKLYKNAVVTCACGNKFTTISTQETITVEICSACHPFFTGTQKFVDTEGRIDKFERRRKVAEEKKSKEEAAKKQKAAKKKKPDVRKSVKEMLEDLKEVPNQTPEKDAAEQETNNPTKSQ